MVDIGARHGVKTVALITWMGQPLGREVGNANEMRESIEVLRGEGPDDVVELTLALGEVMMEVAGIDGGRDALLDAIDSGKALQKLMDVAVAQGGDPAYIEEIRKVNLAADFAGADEVRATVEKALTTLDDKELAEMREIALERYY